MPPEVCLGKPYDHKADVWAVGVILYEMIMLKKPFESDTINGVLRAITSCAYEPLSDDVDPNLKMLVVALLNKDFNKRPSIIDVANVPCVKKEILDFIEENDIEHEVVHLLDYLHQDESKEEKKVKTKMVEPILPRATLCKKATLRSGRRSFAVRSKSKIFRTVGGRLTSGAVWANKFTIEL